MSDHNGADPRAARQCLRALAEDALATGARSPHLAKTLRERYETLSGSVDRTEDSMRSRAGTLAGMLDEVLEDRKAG